MLSGTRTETAAEMIGAVSGFKYTDAGAEIYEFDENSEDYKKMVETNTITLEDFGIALSPAAINGKFALIFSNEEEADQAIIDAFNSYGK